MDDQRVLSTIRKLLSLHAHTHIGSYEPPLAREYTHGQLLRLIADDMVDHNAVRYTIKFDVYYDFYSAKNQYVNDNETTRHIISHYINRKTWAWLMLSTDAYLFQQYISNYIAQRLFPWNEVPRDTIRAHYQNLDPNQVD